MAVLAGCGTTQYSPGASAAGRNGSMDWLWDDSTAGVDMPSTATLEAQASTYRAQTTRLSRGREPLEWARTQYALAITLTILGHQSGDTDHSEEAVAAYHAALEEFTRAREPELWARVQRYLGNAQAQLADQTGDSAHSDDAVSAYRAALEVQTRQRMPLEWAETQELLGRTLLKRAWRDRSLSDAEAGRAALAGAYEVFSEPGVTDAHVVRPYHIESVDEFIAELREERAS